LSKSAKYYYDNEAVKEPAVEGTDLGVLRSNKAAYGQGPTDIKTINKRLAICPDSRLGNPSGTRNKRDVWTVSTKLYREAHFATFPPDLIRPCIRAGCPAGGTVLDPFGGSGTTGEVAASEGRKAILIELNPQYVKLAQGRGGLFCASNPRVDGAADEQAKKEQGT
jgi:DNA modification methylase